MVFRGFSFLHLTRRSLLLTAAALAAASFASNAAAYTLSGKSWPSGSTVVMQLALGNSNRTLSDGNTSWDAAIAPALAAWNQQIARMQFAGANNSGAPLSSGDRVNTVGFSSTVFGQAFGSGTLAVTYYTSQGNNLLEADVLFNTAQTFDSYRGPLKFLGSGFATGDIRRVLLHELGHALGLNHSAGDVVMNALTSDREVLAADDIAGAQSLYGAATQPIPTPTPTPPSGSGSSRLVNISTRMNVGVGNDVLIGGFILKGAQPKKLLLRATGPSLAAGGVKGAMLDPVLELHDSTGKTIAQSDDWQDDGQAEEIRATGVAPTNNAEAALIATLAPGSYTAIVRGFDNSQGVALVEGYELDTPATRLVNLSTRGKIGAGDEVLIGGLIVQGTSGKPVLVRAIGPSLSGTIPNALNNPMLEVYNNAGTLIASNDDWASGGQVNQIIATTVAPTNALESALITTLAPGSYTAIVRGVNGATGVGSVEVYDLEP